MLSLLLAHTLKAVLNNYGTVSSTHCDRNNNTCLICMTTPLSLRGETLNPTGCGSLFVAKLSTQVNAC